MCNNSFGFISSWTSLDEIKPNEISQWRSLRWNKPDGNITHLNFIQVFDLSKLSKKDRKKVINNSEKKKHKKRKIAIKMKSRKKWKNKEKMSN